MKIEVKTAVKQSSNFKNFYFQREKTNIYKAVVLVTTLTLSGGF